MLKYLLTLIMVEGFSSSLGGVLSSTAESYLKLTCFLHIYHHNEQL